MAPQTPLLLVDNVFDTVQLYPTGTVSADSVRTGHEAFRVADYRRERSSWQTSAAAANHHLDVDLGAGITRTVDSIWLDRGHNLWGATVQVLWSDDGAAYTLQRQFTLPAVGTLGGDPTLTVMSITEEGAAWALFAASAAHRWWRFTVVTNLLVVLPGILLGMRSQLLNFSTTFDEDAGERTEISATSEAGYRGTAKTYSWRTVEIGLALIGATEYDATIRTLRRQIFERNQPWVCFLDYGTRPERGWLFQLDGKAWGLSKKRVYREGRIRGREVGASLS